MATKGLATIQFFQGQRQTSRNPTENRWQGTFEREQIGDSAHSDCGPGRRPLGARQRPPQPSRARPSDPCVGSLSESPARGRTQRRSSLQMAGSDAGRRFDLSGALGVAVGALGRARRGNCFCFAGRSSPRGAEPRGPRPDCAGDPQLSRGPAGAPAGDVRLDADKLE